MASTQKKELRKTLPDLDRDGVPNKYDCRPGNPRKQESFLPADEVYLKSKPLIELGAFISEGFSGQVYAVKGRRHLIIKVPQGYANAEKYKTLSHRFEVLEMSVASLKSEMHSYEEHKLEKAKMIIPTKMVMLPKVPGYSGQITGLVRPRIAPVTDGAIAGKPRSVARLSDSDIVRIRRYLILLSTKGLVFKDGLQLGLDVINRPLLYDLGLLKKTKDIDVAYAENNTQWLMFLSAIGRGRDIKKFKEIALPKMYTPKKVMPKTKR